MGRLSLDISLLHRVRRNKLQISKPSHTRRQRSVNRMDDRRVSKKRKLDDTELQRLLDDDDDDEDKVPPQELVVVSARQEDGVMAAAENMDMDMEGLGEEFRHISDIELEEKIKRNRAHLSSLSLADKGAKLRLSIKRMEAECERRKRDKVDK